MKHSPDKNNQKHQQGPIQKKEGNTPFFNPKGGAGTFFGPAAQRKPFISPSAGPVQAKMSSMEDQEGAIQAKMQPGAPVVAQQKSQGSTVAQKKEEVSADQVPANTVDYEFFAHKVAYNPDSMQTEPFATIVTKCGYKNTGYKVFDGPNGFLATLIYPAVEGKAPILAIRGTDNMAGFSTDADFVQVGHRQYHNNKKKIEKALAMAGQKVIVTGHSLGGAMAQIVTANHASSVAKTVTFQSPGVSLSTVNKFNKIAEEDRPEVTHHIMDGDIVDKAGMANLPGDVYEHDFDGINPIAAHTSYVTGTDKFKDQRDAIGMTDEVMASKGMGNQKIRTKDTGITKHKSYPKYIKRALAESGRKVGGVLTAPFRMVEELFN